jgi:hypothetical protein
MTFCRSSIRHLVAVRSACPARGARPAHLAVHGRNAPIELSTAASGEARQPSSLSSLIRGHFTHAC